MLIPPRRQEPAEVLETPRSHVSVNKQNIIALYVLKRTMTLNNDSVELANIPLDSREHNNELPFNINCC